MQRFGATNTPGTCLWCGRKLRRPSTTTWEDTDERPKRCTAAVQTDLYDYEKCGSTDFERSEPAPGRKGPWICANGHRIPAVRRVVSRTPRFEKPGDYGDGRFCGLGCGYQFGLAMAENGDRLQPVTHGRKAS